MAMYFGRRIVLIIVHDCLDYSPFGIIARLEKGVAGKVGGMCMLCFSFPVTLFSQKWSSICIQYYTKGGVD
jgi:hypothetical protein